MLHDAKGHRSVEYSIGEGQFCYVRDCKLIGRSPVLAPKIGYRSNIRANCVEAIIQRCNYADAKTATGVQDPCSTLRLQPRPQVDVVYALSTGFLNVCELRASRLNRQRRAGWPSQLEVAMLSLAVLMRARRAHETVGSLL